MKGARVIPQLRCAPKSCSDRHRAVSGWCRSDAHKAEGSHGMGGENQVRVKSFISVFLFLPS